MKDDFSWSLVKSKKGSVKSLSIDALFRIFNHAKIEISVISLGRITPLKTNLFNTPSLPPI